MTLFLFGNGFSAGGDSSGAFCTSVEKAAGNEALVGGGDPAGVVADN